MTALNFPTDPQTGDVYEQWTWNGTRWVKTPSGGGTSDHRDLTHRNDADQHPIGSIIGLQEALDGASFPTYTNSVSDPPATPSIGESWTPPEFPTVMFFTSDGWQSAIGAFGSTGPTAFVQYDAGLSQLEFYVQRVGGSGPQMELGGGESPLLTFGGSSKPGIFSLDNDPTIGSGYAAPVGTVGLHADHVYRKSGAGDTDWDVWGEGGGGGAQEVFAFDFGFIGNIPLTDAFYESAPSGFMFPVLGQTDSSENGIYVADGSDTVTKSTVLTFPTDRPITLHMAYYYTDLFVAPQTDGMTWQVAVGWDGSFVSLQADPAATRTNAEHVSSPGAYDRVNYTPARLDVDAELAAIDTALTALGGGAGRVHVAFFTPFEACNLATLAGRIFDLTGGEVPEMRFLLYYQGDAPVSDASQNGMYTFRVGADGPSSTITKDGPQPVAEDVLYIVQGFSAGFDAGVYLPAESRIEHVVISIVDGVYGLHTLLPNPELGTYPTITSSGSGLSDSYMVWPFDATGGDFDFALVAADGSSGAAVPRRPYVLKNAGATGTVTLTDETVDGITDFTLAAGQIITILSADVGSGYEWVTIANSRPAGGGSVNSVTASAPLASTGGTDPDISIDLTAYTPTADLADVATSGAYADLSGTPTLGTAAGAATGDFDPAGTAATAQSNAESYTDTVASTKADLVGGTVPSSQLPSYVDDVLEFANLAAFPGTGETGKIYVAQDTNLTYRWTGSAYGVLDPSLALGETSSTAYRGDRGKVAYDHSQLTAGNPHGVTKGDVGLGSVDNTSDAGKPVSTATQAALDLKVNTAQSVNAQTGTTYTLATTDAGALVTLDNASAITLTLPQDSDATIAVGTYVDLYQLGAGQVTVAAGTGATLRTSGLTAKARAQYTRLGVQKVSANTWSLFGDLAAS